MSTETKTDRVLRDVLNSDNLRDFLSENVFDNAMRWRFLQAALYVLDGHGLLGDPADAVEAATPAPLDPSKVKAGDTVTLTVSDGDLPTLTVAGLTHKTINGVYLGGWRIDELPDYVTLTDHQPAPEPEPEWEMTQVAVVTPHGKDDLTTRAIYGEDGNWHNAYGGFWSNDEVSVRPLVVIDPAAVDVDHLVGIGSNTDDPRTNTLAILAGLGLDGAS